jgi:hypothetical protein
MATSVSLLFFLSYEILKWQFPASAAGEKLAMAATALRSWPSLSLRIRARELSRSHIQSGFSGHGLYSLTQRLW